MNISGLLFFIAEMIGTVAFALSGAMTGLKYRLDLFGVLLLAVTTALGGGCIRDLLIGRIPPIMFQDYRYMLAAAITAGAVFFMAFLAKKSYHRNEARLACLANIFDAVGLGAFVVVGVNAGIGAGYGDNGFFLVFLGLMTCIGGGILRDLFVLRVPGVLHKHVYALPCILGGVIFVVMTRLQVSALISTPMVMGVVFGLRMLATKYRWNLLHAE